MQETPSDALKLAHYELIKPLGKGGMGSVFLAKDTRLHRMVAIKRLHADHKPEHRQRLMREAAALAKINHTNVVQLFDILELEEEDNIALVMELVEGADLKSYLKENLVSLEMRLSWLIQIAEGLAAVHAQGIVHRDLKAENILISRKGIAKVTDLGIAKNHEIEEQTELTASGQLVGSFSAFSPEQALSQPLDYRSDIFAFGVLAFRLLCGCHPFGDSKNQAQLLHNLLHHEPLSPSRLNPDLPPNLTALLNQLLQKDKAARPNQAQAVANELKIIQQALPCSAHVITGTATATVSQSALLSDDNQGLDFSLTTQEHVIHDYLKQTAFVPGLESNHTKDQSSKATSLTSSGIFSIGILSLVIIGLTVLGSWYWLENQPPANRYVAVLPPNINPDSPMQAAQQQLVIDALAESLEEQVLSSPILQLISPRDVAKTSGSYRQRAAAVAADMIIASELDCAAQRCEIRLSHVEADINGRWSVQDQDQWPALIDDQYRNLGLEAANRLANILPQYISGQGKGAAQRLSEQDYQAFIHLRREVMITGLVKAEQWQQLMALRNTLIDYLPFYEVAGFLGLLLYDDTQEPEYLDQLLELFETAEQRLGPQLGLLDKQFELYLRQQAFAEAEELITKMQSLGADAATIATEKGLLANYQGRFSDAEKYYQEAVELAPTTGRLYEMANNYFLSGNYSRASDSLNKLKKMNPNDALSLDLQSEVYLHSGQINKAIQVLHKLAENRPSQPIFNNLSFAYQLKGEFLKALDSAEKAIEIAPFFPAARLNKADSLQLLGEKNKAKAEYLKIIDITENKDDYFSQYIYAQAQAQLGQHSKAFTSMHQALRKWPDNPEVLFSAVLVYTLAEQYPVAISYANQTLERGMSPIFFQLAWFSKLCSPDLLNDAGADLVGAVCHTRDQPPMEKDS